mmetsp:Transcript_178226/g.571308  ORF Transcript_178226/g.571308 Transcript_178226/m.571308 type:complete len:93 (-) Transcript_178226:3-281(-)
MKCIQRLLLLLLLLQRLMMLMLLMLLILLTLIGEQHARLLGCRYAMALAEPSLGRLATTAKARLVGVPVPKESSADHSAMDWLSWLDPGMLP